MRSLIRHCLALAFAVLAVAAHAGPATQADFPPGTGPFPTVVLAPGQGYHMDLPAMRETAGMLVARGFAVYRFNWTYWTREPRGEASEDLSAELRDMQSVIAAARADARVDARRIAVGGKSLGSLVAWRAFRADTALTAAALLTPVCSAQVVGDGAPSAVAANYPGLAQEPRPLLFVLGEHDPLCEPKQLFGYLASGKGPVRVSVVGGDHGFEVSSGSAPQREDALRRNLGAVGEAVADFAAAQRPAE